MERKLNVAACPRSGPIHRCRVVSVFLLALSISASVAQMTVEDLYAVTFDKKLLWVNLVQPVLLVATLECGGKP